MPAGWGASLLPLALVTQCPLRSATESQRLRHVDVIGFTLVQFLAHPVGWLKAHAAVELHCRLRRPGGQVEDRRPTFSCEVSSPTYRPKRALASCSFINFLLQSCSASKPFGRLLHAGNALIQELENVVTVACGISPGHRYLALKPIQASQCQARRELAPRRVPRLEPAFHKTR